MQTVWGAWHSLLTSNAQLLRGQASSTWRRGCDTSFKSSAERNTSSQARRRAYFFSPQINLSFTKAEGTYGMKIPTRHVNCKQA